jgi:hypothetical protein
MSKSKSWQIVIYQHLSLPGTPRIGRIAVEEIPREIPYLVLSNVEVVFPCTLSPLSFLISLGVEHIGIAFFLSWIVKRFCKDH